MVHLRPGFFPLPSGPDYAPETKRKGDCRQLFGSRNVAKCVALV